jgi:D-3-phosphoglycerate dehydrogenase / 2-oxoglutarate reductase
MTFTVLVTDRVSPVGLEPLVDDERFEILSIDDSSTPGFAGALAGSDALIVRSATRVDRAMIEAAPTLKVIGRAGVGVDNIEVAAASERGILVFNAPDANTVAAAELTMALMLSLVRRVTEADRSVRDGKWDRAGLQGVELRGKTLGLIGAGRIGGEVARRCLAFEMTVIIYDPYLTADRAAGLGAELVGLDHLLATADIVSIHVPLNDETRGLIDPERLRRLKSQAFVVNASRGGVIDESALAAALEEGRLAGAALDVYHSEPLPGDSPLRSAPNLVLTPHLGASTVEAQVGVAREVAIAIRSALVEGVVSGAVNAAELGAADA